MAGRSATAHEPVASTRRGYLPALVGGNRTRATAVIVTATSGRHGRRDDAGDSLLDGVIDWFSKEPWDLELDVRPSGAAPYRVAVSTKVPNRLGGLRNAFRTWRPVPGLEVPVLIEAGRPDAVEVDWKAFANAGGLREASKATAGYRVEQTSSAIAQAMRSNPKMQAQMRSNALSHGREMAQHVPMGLRPADEFARWVRELEDGGALTAEEAGELRAIAGIAT